jgi:hypothetical protein
LPEVDDVDLKRENGEDIVGKRVKMTSLTSGKGLMKRRAKVEGRERERFGKNLGVLMAARDTPQDMDVEAGGVDGDKGKKVQTSSTASRFAALRNWSGQTMEKEKAFDGAEK